MKIAKLFFNGQSQAVRLPREFRLEGQQEVFIKKFGNAIVLIPKDSQWSIFFESLTKFSKDFMTERKQPEQQKREDLFS